MTDPIKSVREFILMHTHGGCVKRTRSCECALCQLNRIEAELVLLRKVERPLVSVSSMVNRTACIGSFLNSPKQ